MSYRIKEAALNIASAFSLLAIPALIFYTDNWKEIAISWVIVLVIACTIPPFGHISPHEYSDYPNHLREVSRDHAD